MRRNELCTFLLVFMLLAGSCKKKPTTTKPQLIRAIERGKFEYAETLIENGSKVNVRDSLGNTPLIKATQRDDSDLAELLVSKDANVNAANKYGDTPLIEAAKGINKELVKLLLSKGADVNAQGTFLNTALHWAAENGHKPIVQLLIDAGAPLNCRNRSDQTPVDLAMSEEHKEIVKLFVNLDADVSIHMATFAGQLEKVKRFIKNGIDINSEDKKGRTPLFLACYNDNIDLVSSLLTNGAKVNANDNFGLTPLHVAAKNGYANIVELLIEKGANVNAEASDGLELYELHNEYRRPGSRPLHLAVSYIDVIKLLVSNGADINAKDEGGQTPLQKAVFHGDKNVVDFLIAQGAEIGIHLAAYIGNYAKVKSLIEKGADPNSRNNDGDSVLDLAVSGGHKEIAKLLIDSGANLNAKNRMGQTPLHIAARTGYKDIAELLIDKGANVNISNNEGRTPLLEAAYSGHKDLVALFVSNGADLNAKAQNGMTALDYAIRSGFNDIVELLSGATKGLSIDTKEPNTIIVTDPKAVRRFLRFNSTNFDDVWIPQKTDIEGLSSALKSYLEENAPVKRLSIFEREAVMSEFRRYNQEYSGFIIDGTKYIICNMWLSGGFEHSVYISSIGSSKNNFTIIFDGWYAAIQVVFDAGSKKVVRIGHY
jgi:ankyrin repeat protein